MPPATGSQVPPSISLIDRPDGRLVEAGLRRRTPRRGLTRQGRRGTILLYAAAALLGTALFIFLHHLGNRLSYDTAVRRFAAEFATDRPDEGITAGFKSPFEYCKFAGMVLAGAREPADTAATGRNPLHAVRDAVLLRELAPVLAYYNHCDELTAAVHGYRVYEQFAPPQYWFGSKAVYAVLLRVLAVREVRLLIRIGTWAGWIALAAALLLRAPRTLAVVSPLIVFGCLFSGIRYFSGSANGMPYLWTVWAAVALALLLHARQPPRITMAPETRLRLTRLLCFVIGMVSTYLYLGGHTVLSVTLIGLLVYFGAGGSRQSRRSASRTESGPAGGLVHGSLLRRLRRRLRPGTGGQDGGRSVSHSRLVRVAGSVRRVAGGPIGVAGLRLEGTLLGRSDLGGRRELDCRLGRDSPGGRAGAART